MQAVLELLRKGPYLEGGGWYGIDQSSPRNSHLKDFNTFSVSLQLQLSILLSLHSSKAFCVCDSQKVLTRCLRPGLRPAGTRLRELTTPLRPRSWLRRGTPPPHPSSTPSASRYRRLSSVNPQKFFMHSTLVAQLYLRALDSRHLLRASLVLGASPSPQKFQARTALDFGASHP